MHKRTQAWQEPQQRERELELEVLQDLRPHVLPLIHALLPELTLMDELHCAPSVPNGLVLPVWCLMVLSFGQM